MTYLPLGTRRLTPDGYVRVKVGRSHHLAMIAGSWAYEHMLIMEQKLGRRLQPGELVHHEDEDKANNDPNNLELTTRPDHCAQHLPRLGTATLTCKRGHSKAKVGKCRTCENAAERARYWRDKHGY